MSHEITSQDQVVLHKERAWHGLGVVVEKAPTPKEALDIIGADWGVVQRPIRTTTPDGKEIVVEDRVANFRADTNSYFGIVSSSYQPIQNWEVAEFCEALLEEGEVKCETAGTIKGGKKIWFLLKGEPFNIRKEDEVIPYVCVSNGHDGFTTFRVTPTTVRTVCSNTLHMVIPMHDTGELGQSAITLKHTTNVMERVQEARMALARYGQSLDGTREMMDDLAHKENVSQANMEKFFWGLYQSHWGEVPTNPKDGWEERRLDRARSAFSSFSRRFDDEKDLTGASWWGVLNAYTGMVQHDQKARGKDDTDRVERRVDSNLFGLNQDRTQDALRMAFSMAG